MVAVTLMGVAGTVEAYTTQQVLGSSNYVRGGVSSSGNGHQVAFITGSALVASDTNSKEDAYVKDMKTGTVSLISARPDGTAGGGRTYSTVKLTGNGRFALFNSEAADLAAASGAPYRQNIYLRDLLTSTTYLIAAGINGSNVDHYPSGVSEDGRFVYYTSQLYGLGRHMFVLDRSLNVISQVDVNSSNTLGNGIVIEGTDRTVSCDGRFVVFSSGSTNLVANDSNGVNDVFLVDRMGGHSVVNLTQIGNDSSNYPEITCDGNYVLFESRASNIVEGDTNATRDLFRYSLVTGSIERVSLQSNGQEYLGAPTATELGYVEGGDISMDGRYIFYIEGTRAVSTYDSENFLVMRDIELNQSTVIAPAGSGYYARYPVTSYDGRVVFYVSVTNISTLANPRLRMVTGHL